MSDFVVVAEKRTDVGKGASRRLRRADKVPAVVYGGSAEPESLTVDHNELIKQLEHEAFYSSILTLEVGGKKSKAVLKDLQRHPYKPKVLHMDLQRVDPKEKLHMHVPLHFIGDDVAPGVKAGGLLSHSMTDLEVSCLAKDLPEYLEVDVSSMEIGDVLHISDVKLPKGVESVALSHGPDHDLPVATMHKTRGASEEAAAEGEGAEEGGEE